MDKVREFLKEFTKNFFKEVEGYFEILLNVKLNYLLLI
jgi:hypothetical protein